MRKTLSVALAVYNEEENLAKCLDTVKDFADEIVIVDGTSTDRTVEIAKKYGAKVIVRENPKIFHINKQIAIDACTKDWILQLDADEHISRELKEEILHILEKEEKYSGYWIPRKNYFLGRFLLKGGQYPDYTVRFYKKGKGRLPQKDVHEQAEIEGEVGYLKSPLLHYPYKDFAFYLKKWDRYNSISAMQMREESGKKSLAGKIVMAILHLLIKPNYWFLLTFIRHKGFVDLWQGFVFSLFSALRFPVSYGKYITSTISSIYKKIMTLALILVVLFSWVIIETRILMGGIGFWYDVSRDFLLAWDNHSKISLIGPTSGISGVFYGPHWVWLESIFLLVSKNPVFTVFSISTLLYFVIFPLVIFKLTKFYSKITVLSLLMLFTSAYTLEYAVSPWNPYLAPPIVLGIIYFAAFKTENIKKKKNIIILGLLTGLLVNIHVSLGIGIALGIFLYLFIKNAGSRENVGLTDKFTALSLVIGGVLASSSPFLMFEVRHGFIQTKAILFTLFNSEFTGMTGIPRNQVLIEFLNRGSKLFGFPLSIFLGLFLIMASVFLIGIARKTIQLRGPDKNILLLVFLIWFSLSAIYLGSRNPIWIYHFIGFEIVFLYLFILLFTKIKFAKYILAAYSIFIFSKFFLITAYGLLPGNFISFLDIKKDIVNTVVEDIGTEKYEVYVYSPSIYSYDFTYLFKWLGNKNVPYDPSIVDRSSVDTVYIILPEVEPEIGDDFINFRSPPREFITSKEWNIDTFNVLRRDRK